MIRVLNVIGSLMGGGAETTIMNYYRNIDRSTVQFDFLLSYDHGYYESEAISLGARIFRRPMRTKDPLGNANGLIKVLKENPEIKVIHVHTSIAISAVDLLCAMLCGVPVRIAHSRNATPTTSPFLHRIFQPLLRAVTTHRVGCSTEAGISLFGKKTWENKKHYLMNNARDIEPFRYNLERRNIVRKELGLHRNYVLLSVGRLSSQKNQAFLLDFFSLARKRNTELILLIAGIGELHEDLTQKAKKLALEDSVRFLEFRDDIPNLMQAADLFVLPSLHEGLPGVAVEAQAAGLPCLISDTVTQECKLTEAVEFLPIDKGPDLWADRITAYDNFARHDTFKKISDGGYEIHEAAKRLEAFYIYAMQQEKRKSSK